MKIVLVVHKFFPRFKAGTEVLTLGMAKILLSLGHEVTIVAGEPTDACASPKVSQDFYEGIPVYRIAYSTKSFANRIKAHYDNPLVESLLVDTVAALAPDVVHFNHIIGLSAGSLAAIKSLGVSVLFSPTDFWCVCPTICLYRFWEEKVCNGPDEHAVACVRCLLGMPTAVKRYLPNFVVNAFFRISRIFSRSDNCRLSTFSSLLLRKDKILHFIDSADTVVVATSFMKEVFVQNGLCSDKIRIVPFGIDIVIDQAANRNMLFLQNRKRPLVIGYIGSLERHKGAHILIQAYQSLSLDPSQAILKIYGDINVKNGYSDFILNLVQKYPSGISFEGVFPNAKIGEVLSCIDVIVVPSIWYENTPLVLLSAIAARVPVIVSDLGGMTEVVQNGVNGFSFESNNSDALAGVISRFLEKPELVMMSSSQTEGMMKDMKQYVDDIESIYLDLIKSA